MRAEGRAGRRHERSGRSQSNRSRTTVGSRVTLHSRIAIITASYSHRPKSSPALTLGLWAMELVYKEKKESLMFRLISIALSISLMNGLAQAQNPTARPARPTPPTRDPNTPGYVTAKELPDGANAPV